MGKAQPKHFKGGLYGTVYPDDTNDHEDIRINAWWDKACSPTGEVEPVLLIGIWDIESGFTYTALTWMTYGIISSRQAKDEPSARRLILEELERRGYVFEETEVGANAD
jgi:hypothetical protein